jgi:hypothetical protein
MIAKSCKLRKIVASHSPELLRSQDDRTTHIFYETKPPRTENAPPTWRSGAEFARQTVRDFDDGDESPRRARPAFRNEGISAPRASRNLENEPKSKIDEHDERDNRAEVSDLSDPLSDLRFRIWDFALIDLNAPVG